MTKASEPRQEDPDYPVHEMGDDRAGRAPVEQTASGFAPQWLVVVLSVVSIIAMGITAYLASIAFQSSDVYGCGGGRIFDCGHVLTSRWSKVFGIPVSVPAFGLYASCLAALIFCRKSVPVPVRRMAWRLVTACGVAAGLAAIWFLSLQIFDLGHLCTYCLSAHICGLIVAGLLFWRRPLGTAATAKISLLSVGGVAVLITTQMLTPPPPTFQVEYHDDVMDGTLTTPDGELPQDEAEFEVFEPFDLPIPTSGQTPPPDPQDSSEEEEQVVAGSPLLFLVRLTLSPQDESSAGDDDEGTDADSDAAKKTAADDEANSSVEEPEPRLIGISGGKTKLNIRHWPLLGSPDSKYCFVEMFDYTCPHCRNMHVTVKKAFEEYGDDLAIIALPVPLNSRCNDTVRSTHSQHAESCEIAELAIAVWRLDQAKFHQFHDWLFEPAGGRRASEARNYAAELVGADELKEELASGNPGKYVAAHVKLYKQVGSNQLPKLLFERTTLVGEVGSVQTIRSYLEGR